MLEKLLPTDIYDALSISTKIDAISEIRIRISKPIKYKYNNIDYTLNNTIGVFIANNEHINAVLANATKRSMYAYNDEISRGYITYLKGIRIGIAGKGVEDKGKVRTIKEINSLAIRVPHEIKGIADDIINAIDVPSNILIIAPPGVGKTTILRDVVRILSDKGYDIALIDEREEIYGSGLDVGSNTDIISNIIKIDAYTMAIRSLSPDIIATDEVFGDSEIDSILDIIRAGIKVIATVHGLDIMSLAKTPYRRLLDAFDYAITIEIVNAKHIYKVDKL